MFSWWNPVPHVSRQIWEWTDWKSAVSILIRTELTWTQEPNNNNGPSIKHVNLKQSHSAQETSDASQIILDSIMTTAPSSNMQ